MIGAVTLPRELGAFPHDQANFPLLAPVPTESRAQVGGKVAISRAEVCVVVSG